MKVTSAIGISFDKTIERNRSSKLKITLVSEEISFEDYEITEKIKGDGAIDASFWVNYPDVHDECNNSLSVSSYGYYTDESGIERQATGVITYNFNDEELVATQYDGSEKYDLFEDFTEEDAKALMEECRPFFTE